MPFKKAQEDKSREIIFIFVLAVVIVLNFFKWIKYFIKKLHDTDFI